MPMYVREQGLVKLPDSVGEQGPILVPMLVALHSHIANITRE